MITRTYIYPTLCGSRCPEASKIPINVASITALVVTSDGVEIFVKGSPNHALLVARESLKELFETAQDVTTTY